MKALRATRDHIAFRIATAVAVLTGLWIAAGAPIYVYQ